MLEVRSRSERALLTHYFLNPTAKHHLLELARLLDVDASNLDKKLKKYVKNGLFRSESRGNQRLYSLNHDFPLFKEYQSIINKTYGLAAQLKAILKNIPYVNLAYLFGSYARGNHDTFSDIDLLVVGNHDSMILSAKLHYLEALISREINVVEIEPLEFEQKRTKDPFLIHVFQQKIIQLI